MTDRTASNLARGAWVLIMASLVSALVLALFNDRGGDPVLLTILPLMAVGYGTVGALIASRKPRSPIGWLYMVTGFALALSGVADNYVGAFRSGIALPGARWFAWIGSLTFGPAFAAIPLVLLLFPNGRLPSRRWRPVGWVMALAPLLGILGLVIHTNPVGGESGHFANPTALPALKPLGSILLTIAGVGSLVAALACIVALVLRFRRSRGEERQQLRWLAYAGGFSGVLLVALFVVGSAAGGEDNPVSVSMFWLFILSLGLGIPAASAIAILRYRLYELDIVIKKAVVFGLLAAGITLVYVALVIGIPTLVIGVGADTGFDLIQFAAIVLIALLINPLRSRARRLADRLVYGKRATPYEVLSEFSDRMGGTYSTEDVLPRMVQLISAGTGARRSEVWLRVGPDLRLEAAWPDVGKPASKPMAGDELPLFEGARAFEVKHQGELLGALAVTMPPSDPLTPDQEKLLRDLAAQAGLVLRNVALTADLRARLEELRASRQRVVAAQDEERRRLERNIHDGAQQQLVAIGVKLGLAKTLMDRDPAKAGEMLGQLQAENQDALETLRDLARGIYPPLLADQGLAAALQAQARKSPVPVDVEPDGIGRYEQEVEAAVYFSSLEALQNVAKYANASRVVVRLSAGDDELRFEVIDDGAGFDPSRTPRGSGLTNMADRLAAIGGEIEVTSRPGEGTVVRGRVPTVGRPDERGSGR